MGDYQSNDDYLHSGKWPTRAVPYSSWRQPEIAAEVPAVPAVRITRDRWEQIQGCLRDLAALGVTGRPVESSLIRGAVIADAVNDAVDLCSVFGITEDQ